MAGLNSTCNGSIEVVPQRLKHYEADPAIDPHLVELRSGRNIALIGLKPQIWALWGKFVLLSLGEDKKGEGKQHFFWPPEYENKSPSLKFS